MAPITFYHNYFTGKKRKTNAAAHSEVMQKKVKLNESTVHVRKGTECPSVVSGGAAASCNGCAYFASRFEIHEFEIASKNWTKIIDCPYESFGLVSKENELIVVGGFDKSGTPTNKILCFSLEKKDWEEKYPPMIKARISPQVVVADKYLIVLGRYADNRKNNLQMYSIEIYDFEKKHWFLKSLSLKGVANIEWLSACVFRNDLYVAVSHSDPDYFSTMEKVIYDDVGSLSSDQSEKGVEDYDEDLNGYPCYSLFRCPVDTIQEGKEVKWQKVEYLHPSVYENPNDFSDYNSKLYSKAIDERFDDGFGDEKEDYEDDYSDIEGKLQCLYNGYCVCHFAIACINDRLIAVGCEHIKSMSHEELQETLYNAYDKYRHIARYDYQAYLELGIETDPEETTDTTCHIHEYCTESDSWRCVKSTPKNGTSDKPPSVACVNGSLVIMRNSKTVHIVDFP